ncbi:hypothetical protein [Microcoleus sp. BROC3]|uniref:hypothetical protein n=1 Tax=Microcoleus sp. BROC3 TaxID=3055323 RepID=UPI002FD41866
MSVVLRAQIQESEAIRPTQAIAPICITAGSNREFPLLIMREPLNKAKYLDNLASAVGINNQKKINFVISHQSSVIGNLSLIYLFIISHLLTGNRF